LAATPPGSSAADADAAPETTAAAPPLRLFHLQGERVEELDAPPAELPATGFLWIACPRRLLELSVVDIQGMLQRWTGATLFEPHVSDLLNRQLPSNFDTTSDYDLLVFRRLAATAGAEKLFADASAGSGAAARDALKAIDTSAVGFAAFDRVLLTVHPVDCQVRDAFVQRLLAQAAVNGGGTTGSDGRPAGRLPASPADLMVRMLNHIVDRYLELRRLLTRQIDFLQQRLFEPKGRFQEWTTLLDTRNALHMLEGICEDQRDAIVEWIDAIDEWPDARDPERQRAHEQLRVRSKDVQEHVERVLSHVRRLESQSETAVQMHFSQQSHRANETMRTLTTLTAIFLPLNLVTGFFGMNFQALPLIDSARGFWIIFGLILVLGAGASAYFWRRRLLGRL
jgi:Mg2+ and Co2+ transporter CorA